MKNGAIHPSDDIVGATLVVARRLIHCTTLCGGPVLHREGYRANSLLKYQHIQRKRTIPGRCGHRPLQWLGDFWKHPCNCFTPFGAEKMHLGTKGQTNAQKMLQCYSGGLYEKPTAILFGAGKRRKSTLKRLISHTKSHEISDRKPEKVGFSV